MTEIKIPKNIVRKMVGSRQYKLQRDGKPEKVRKPWQTSDIVRPSMFASVKNWLRKLWERL